MEKDNPGKKLAFIFILLVLVICLFTGKIKIFDKEFDFKSLLNINSSSQELVDSMTVEKNSINTINLLTFSTDLEIKETQEDIKIEYYSNTENNPKIIKEENSIRLDESNYDNTCFGICNINRKLVLYIPANYDGKLNIVTTSGDIKATTNINIRDEVDIVTGSGDVSLLDINNIFVKTTSGDIKIGEGNDTLINTTSGDVHINKVNNRIALKTVSGDVLVKELNIKENSSLTTISGDIKINNNVSNCYVNESTISGDVRIKKSNRKSNIELKIKTTSGDITVN